ncbi:SENESCENCE-RELATED GENE 1, senescence-related gene 1 [Hibiscus trionum]|uniref:SENESCENCE-RELATED GENE 1, senescence-related gene 1 n=1 Tax=Hibiscus trionum TaxID=183268 RepID=A0A9W7MQ58_HIBTR|nr:SENESCENCE-RELATED GENE 1, senescence-related gene 1 [Hibiscus trionum]
MGSKVPNVGSSLLVPSVQELAKQPLSTIPNRYLRPEIEREVVPDGSPKLEIPVIDMQRLVSEESMDSEIDTLGFACKEWGFFQLVNHGVSLTLLDKLKTQIREFFNLPMEEKNKFWQSPGQVEGFGQSFVVSEDQKLDWADMFYMITLPLHLRKPHLFPRLPLPLRDTMELYSSELNNLYLAILAKMAEALNMKTEEMEEFIGEGRQAMRVNYYPPCHLPEQVIGLTPHSDASVITILLQLNEVEGLQIKKDGKWVSVKPLPNAFIVNIGDIFEIITNGTYRSIEHRATVNSKRERLSIATFCGLGIDGEIGPAPSLISEQTPAIFRRVKVEEYYKGLFARKLQGKSYLDFMRTEHD